VTVSANLAAVLYLVAGVFFILALRGLSSPESSRRGNQFGIAGMTIAVVTTLFSPRRDGAVPPDPARHLMAASVP
jgi:NAD(P) transhydrogenase subunit beta